MDFKLVKRQRMHFTTTTATTITATIKANGIVSQTFRECLGGATAKSKQSMCMQIFKRTEKQYIRNGLEH